MIVWHSFGDTPRYFMRLKAIVKCQPDGEDPRLIAGLYAGEKPAMFKNILSKRVSRETVDSVSRESQVLKNALTIIR